ncbi:Putative arylsulfatase regulatory protein [Arcticibacter svalbardensis MN12-7]|uniref:Putative arylsulfatase regulatory protein n=1 Tax=Arcticibacter svalbardensis MN12-7 TaxID=1150600 RepID=R9GXF0_9SPHI|nr:anaerobic sulfatase-maturation protein [Arcticibacter svalbardensis]EOR93634.1 Putative arylsulfatase regulatory protein [Arcticibacter svalbardensis MN12-7]
MSFPELSGFNILANPTGPICNLNCTYCYYLEKEKIYPGTSSFKMTEQTLEVFTRKYIHEQPGPEVTFVWQGGEPSLLGLEYYKKALQFQQKYGSGKRIHNSFQTNGVLLNEEWCLFFKEHDFLIGISIDGPKELHDKYRLDKGGHGTFSKVMAAIELLKKHQVKFNTLTVINNINCDHPLEVYRFLKQIGSQYLQFIPIVEQVAEGVLPEGVVLLSPDYAGKTTLAPWSVSPLKFGKFLVAIFNEWVKKDVGRYFVQIFDATLANEAGVSPGICVFSERCGNALAVEHNGDLYSCDHYVYPEYKLGNIHSTSLKKVLLSDEQRQFGLNKYDSLPRQCKECDVYSYCKGECPKNRFLVSRTNEGGLNYLCEGYKLFFRHAKPYMKYMNNELLHQRSPAHVMNLKR